MGYSPLYESLCSNRLGKRDNNTTRHDFGLGRNDREEQRERWFASFRESCRSASQERYLEKTARSQEAQQEAESSKQARANRKAQKLEAGTKHRRAERERLIEKAMSLGIDGRVSFGR